MKEPRQRRPLPGLGEVPADLPGIRQFISRMKEIIELREGRRGVGESEKVVTFGDLDSMGVTKVLSAAPGQKGPVEAAVESTITNQTFIERFIESLKNTYLFRRLFSAIDDVELLKQYPDEVRRELERNMMEVARQRQADIFETQEKIQTATRSLAQRVEWVTASLDKSSSAVRELTFAFSEKDKAMAGKITQVESRLDDVGGVKLEEALETWVSVENGMYGGYTVKLNMKDANGELIKSAAFGLSVEQPVGGEASSQFIIGADKFAIFTNGGSVTPFGVDANGVYINGSLRISGSSASVASIGRTVELTSTAMAFITPKNGGADVPSSITFTATARGYASPVYKWYVDGVVQPGQTGATFSVTNSIINGSTKKGSVKVEVSDSGTGANTTFDVMTVYQVREGEDSLAAGLTNEAHTIACDEAGNPVSGSLPVESQLIVARGATVLTSGVSYSVSASGCSVSTGSPYNTASTGRFAVASVASDNATVTITATVGGTSLTKVMTLTKSRAGKIGQGQVKGICFLRSATQPAAPSGGSYANPTANGWSDGIPAGTAPLYMTTRIFTSDGLSPQQSSWTTPQLTSAMGQGVKAQFSVNGVTNWHDTPTTEDQFMRTGRSTDGGVSWVYDGAVKVKGEAGPKGDPGAQGPQGLPGVNGARGASVGSGTSASDSAFTASTGLFPINGDQMIVSSGSGTAIYTRQAGYWVTTTAFYLNGNAVIDGTLAVNKLASGARSIDGSTFRLGAGSYVAGYGSGAAFTASSSSIFAAIVTNSGGTALGVGSVGTGPAANFVNSNSSSYSVHFTGVEVASKTRAGYFVHYGTGYSAQLGTASHSAYLNGPAGPFTGAHDGLLRRGLHEYPELGDILVDVDLVATKGVGDAICENDISRLQCQKGAIGVFAGFADPYHTPTTLTDNEGAPIWNISTYRQLYRFLVINSVGEGLINVCGEGGDIEIGDLIVTSSIPGKGMKQADDIVRSITVAKAREAVTFASPAEVKQIACIYLCG